ASTCFPAWTAVPTPPSASPASTSEPGRRASADTPTSPNRNGKSVGDVAVSDPEYSVATRLLDGSLRLPGGERLGELEEWDPVQQALVVDDSTDVPPGLGPQPQPSV